MVGETAQPDIDKVVRERTKYRYRCRALCLSHRPGQYDTIVLRYCQVLNHHETFVSRAASSRPIFEKLYRELTEHRKISAVCGSYLSWLSQACRGVRLEHGIEYEEVDGKVDKVRSGLIPCEADMLYVYSTPPGYFSWRNGVDGSWFVQSLCDQLTSHKDRLDLVRILTRVNRQVALHFESTSSRPQIDRKKQMPSIVSMLTKDLYFFT